MHQRSLNYATTRENRFTTTVFLQLTRCFFNPVNSVLNRRIDILELRVFLQKLVHQILVLAQLFQLLCCQVVQFREILDGRLAALILHLILHRRPHVGIDVVQICVHISPRTRWVLLRLLILDRILSIGQELCLLCILFWSRRVAGDIVRIAGVRVIVVVYAWGDVRRGVLRERSVIVGVVRCGGEVVRLPCVRRRCSSS